MHARTLLGLVAMAVPLIVCAPIEASQTRTVSVTAEVYGLGRTPEQAKHEALRRARDKAVAEVAGIRVAAQQLRLRSESGDAVRDAFSYLIHTSTSGRIVAEEVTYSTRVVDDIPLYRATLIAEVVLEEGQRDPGFTVELKTRPATHTYRDGEAIEIEISASRGCYLTVFNLHADGSISVLLPNPYAAGNRLEQGETLRLPGPTERFEIRATLAPGRAIDNEQILAVATLDAVGFELPSSREDEVVPDGEATSDLTALNRWLLRIPTNRRTEVLWEFEVIE